MTNTQIYSATYSNVPVFEFVTSEGPIMRRKADGWINATHILKIAKFPKAKRTRILEKDVQTGTHEKVQGGYGKFQGTYVPLGLGIEIAKNFGVFDVLKPIFEFRYVEGESDTPPPAPKHNHASALNVAKRAAAAAAASAASSASAPQGAYKANNSNTNNLTDASGSTNTTGRKPKLVANKNGEAPKKRGRPKRVTLSKPLPSLDHSDTTPIDLDGPSIGTFNNKSGSNLNSPSLRQDTIQDAPIRQEDLELAESDDDDDDIDSNKPRKIKRSNGHQLDSHHDELMNSKELFGTPKDSFDKIVQSHITNQLHQHIPHSGLAQLSQAPMSNLQFQLQHQPSHPAPSQQTSISQQPSFDPYSLQQYHLPSMSQTPKPGLMLNEDSQYTDYFSNLLSFFLDDSKSRSNSQVPEKILNPPQPISKLNINQPIDNDGNTIFHWACSMGNIQMIQFLIDTFGVNPDIRNQLGETPLMFLVKFNNSFELKNFPSLLNLLLESILSVDNMGKTVLHHISQIEFNDKKNKNKERFARYYMETLLDKLIEAADEVEENDKPENGHGNQNQNETENDKLDRKEKDIISKFTNHQDSDGNTAFHITAYNLNKKLIKVFIGYHKYIDFSLRNIVSFTVEDYLASHNFVLRLEPGAGGEKTTLMEDMAATDSPYGTQFTTGDGNIVNTSVTQSFESQLYNTKTAVNLQNTTSNLITEKLTELAYAIDKELNEKDETILDFFKIIKKINLEKLESQRNILKLFKMEYLVSDLEQNVKEESTGQEELIFDFKTDSVVQDEINRVTNDLCFQFLQKKNEFVEEALKLENSREVLYKSQLQESVEQYTESGPDSTGDSFALSTELNNQIIRRRDLLRKLYKEQLGEDVSSGEPIQYPSTSAPTSPYISTVPSDTSTVPSSNGKDKSGSASPTPSSASSNSSTQTLVIVNKPSIIANYPQDDKLNKYCRLLSLCCGMEINEVESSIDLIEQSLIKTSR